MKRKTLALLTALTMALFAFTACSTPEAPSEVSSTGEEQPVGEAQGEGITAGIYEYVMTPEGRENMQNFFHFYENGVYYFSAYNGGQYEAGFYEVLDEPIEFVKENGEPGSTEQTLVLLDLSGAETGRYGFDGDTIFRYAPFYDNDFVHVLDTDHSPADESGVAVEEFMIEGDEYSTVQLNHNGSFRDSIGAILEGTWEKDGDVYSLTEEDSGEVYTLTVNGDTAVYVGLDGEEYTLVRVQDVQVQLVFSGSGEGEYGEVDITIFCYEDGSAELVVGVSGTSNASAGTWALDSDYSHIAFVLEGEEYQAPMDAQTQTFTLTLEMAGATVELTNGDGEEAELLLTFVGEENTNVRLEMYSDGACALVYEGMGTVTEGSWEMDTSSALPAFTIVLEDGGEIEVESDYATKYFFAYSNEGGTLNETLELSFDALGAALG